MSLQSFGNCGSCRPENYNINRGRPVRKSVLRGAVEAELEVQISFIRLFNLAQAAILTEHQFVHVNIDEKEEASDEIFATVNETKAAIDSTV